MSAVPHPTPTGLLVLQIADLLDIPWLLLPLDGRSVCVWESRLEEEQGALDLRLNKGPVTKSSLNGTVLVPYNDCSSLKTEEGRSTPGQGIMSQLGISLSPGYLL